MPEPLAHSARHGRPAQSYHDHVYDVTVGTGLRAARMLRHYNPQENCIPDAKHLLSLAFVSAAFHDLGKLDKGVQQTLAVNRKSIAHIRHEDAGVVYLAKLGYREAAGIVSAHHQGLIEYEFEHNEEELTLEPNQELDIARFRIDTGGATERCFDEYLAAHHSLFGKTLLPSTVGDPVLDGFTRRLLLSCLVDADHTDTARHYEEFAMEPIPMCQWNKRLVALDAYVNGLRDTSKNNSDLLQRRAKTRTDLYNACRHDDHTDRFRACNAPVGTGKTTALMAHLLRVAKQRNLRHIIVVLPFTNIIRQSVQTYRTALRLPGETEEDMLAVVAEHHHQAEFASLGLRHLTTLWKAPIIVTTAVQFFETLAASKTSRLRKLHELPGSAVSLDEAHAAIPYALWPICWRWLRQWASDWNGHLVLASGSLPRFWEIDEFRSLTERKLIGTSPSRPSSNVCFLAQAQSDAAANLEKQRVTFSTIENPLSGEQLTQRVFEEIRSSGGPSLVIVNTVQSAAVLANMLRTKAEYPVLHISTALAPCHRALIVERVKAMLSYQKQWILVATSIVESGLDFSFSSAFRQRASVASILQVGGRVNRHGKERNSRVWDFDFAPDYQLPNNRQLQSSAEMLSRLFKDGWFAPDSPLDLKAICLYAMRAEFSATKQEKATQLVKLEDYCNYPAVSESCRVIDADTRTVIIDPELGKAVRLNLIGKGPPVSWRNLQLQSVQLYASKIDTLGIEPIANSNELFILPDSWSYDPDFLGYMAGALPLIHAKEEGFII